MSDIGGFAEMLNAVMVAQSRLDTSWTLFLSINSTIIGGVVLIERKFHALEKCLAIVIYSLLVQLNFATTTSSIVVLKTVYSDISKYQYTPDEPGYNTVHYYSELMDQSLLWSTHWFVPCVYLTAYAIVILSITFDGYFTHIRKETAQKECS